MPAAGKTKLQRCWRVQILCLWVRSVKLPGTWSRVSHHVWVWQCMASVSSTTGHKMEQAHSCVPRLLQYLQKAALLLQTPVWPGLHGHGGDLH